MRISPFPSKSIRGTKYRRSPAGGGGGGGDSGGDSGGEVGGEGGADGGSIGGGGSSSGGSSGGGSSSSGGSRGGGISIGSGSTTGGRTSASSSSKGGGPMTTIPSGQMFAGRSQGGGTRDQIYGSSIYGSGYPGNTSRGVADRGFPFYFWPVVWGSTAGSGAAYLHDSEYGDPNNSSRPGGVLTTVPFSSLSGNTTLHIIADNATVISLLSSIGSNCSSVLASNSTGSQAVLSFDPSNSSMPKPEQAVQYYRASSIVLTLDGYNDTVALNASASVNDTQTPLPSWINTSMLNCVNETIGAAAPLVDATSAATSPTTNSCVNFETHSTAFITLAWLIISISMGIL